MYADTWSDHYERLIERVQGHEEIPLDEVVQYLGRHNASLFERIMRDDCWNAAAELHKRCMPPAYSFELHATVVYYHTDDARYAWSGSSQFGSPPHAWLLAILRLLQDPLAAMFMKRTNEGPDPVATHWAILFHDASVGPELFDDSIGAQARFEAVTSSYNCSLYREVQRG